MKEVLDMNLSVTPSNFFKCRSNEKERSAKEVFSLIKSSGFDFIDYDGGEYETINDTAELLDSLNLKVNQSHAPFNRYSGQDYTEFGEKLMECIKKAHAVSSPIFVVHGDEFDFENLTYTPDAALEFNYKLFYPCVEFAAKNGMRIAFENVFEDGEKNPRFCSKTEDVIALVERFNCETVGICWDFGHGKVQHPSDYLDKLRLAGKHLIATHIHDNYHRRDLHLMPFFGDCDWEECMRILRDVNYTGDFTFEFSYDRLPLVLMPEQLRLLHKIGEYLIELYK